MTEEALKELASSYFEIYPEKEVLYGTSDGNIFLHKNPAIDHAKRSRPPLRWYEFTKADPDQVSQPTFGIDAGTAINPELQIQDELKAEALTIDPVTGDYRSMLRILNGLHLVAESKKKEDVKTAFANLTTQLLADAANTNE